MQHNSAGQISGVDDQILASVTGYLPSLPNVQADEADRFAQSVRAIVEKLAQNGWQNEASSQDVAVFVMVSHPRKIGQKYNAESFLDLSEKKEPILGRIFFCNRDASNGQAIQLPIENPNSLIDWLTDNGFSSCPIMIVYRDTKTIVMRRAGTEDLSHRVPIRDQPPNATIYELLETLEYFHKNCVLTPSCDAKGVWEPGRAGEYIPGSEPEKSIQRYLQIALAFKFHGIIRVDTEDKTKIGRIDVRLLKENNQGSGLTYWAIIELKVIKSFANSKNQKPSSVATTTNIDAIVEGIEQAWAFRNITQTQNGFLEIFDLRKDKSDDLMLHTKVTDALKKFTPSPTCNVRPVFGSSSDARHAGFSGA